MLRSLRHDPPGWARKGERKLVFGSALEQAEQLFAAARVVTPATSPLLLFYGLSQAGRAVAASATGKENANRWRLAGHGVTNEQPTGLNAATIAALKVRNQESGAFTQVADILNAASLPDPVSLGNLWCLLPESGRFPLPGMGDARPIDISLTSYETSGDSTVTATVPVPVGLINRADMVPDFSGLGANWDEKRAGIRDFLAQFPSLQGWQFTSEAGQPIEVRGYGAEITQVNIQWDKPAELEAKDALLRHATGYRGAHLAFPAIGTDPRAPHPFLLWWAILYVLSKLARYEPSTWASLTSISSSSAAAPIEHVLRESMAILPELIHRTIFEVAAPPV
ncbi:YaaC family protein [Micromonospora noduli]|uniref:YaaC family protein n=1 Tax=Micromonospora noduli TaxID=709876 RepID=UPI0011BDCC40|nr:hypothetical protein [Micromonospora noduli]